MIRPDVSRSVVGKGQDAGSDASPISIDPSESEGPEAYELLAAMIL